MINIKLLLVCCVLNSFSAFSYNNIYPPSNGQNYSFGYKTGGIQLEEALFPEKSSEPGPGDYEIKNTVGKSTGVR